jgi:uncharacterized protein (TIGR02001 family)
MRSTVTRLSLLVAAFAAAAPVLADDGIAYNLGAVSEYRYRGVSQSRLKPALQGGVDFTKGPFYLGAWASTIKWVKDGGGNAPAELDLYGGYKGEITKGLTFDVGALAYVYPRHEAGKAGLVSPNTFELYGALSYGPATLKYSHATTNLFGFDDSKGSGYLELGATFDVGSGFSLVPHVGYQRVKGFSDASYTDYSLTVSKEVSGVALSAGVVGTDANGFYVSPTGKALDKARLVVGAKYNF